MSRVRVRGGFFGSGGVFFGARCRGVLGERGPGK